MHCAFCIRKPFTMESTCCKSCEHLHSSAIFLMLITLQSLNIPNLIAKQSLIFVDVETETAESYTASQPSLRRVFDRLISLLHDEAHLFAHTLLIVDDLSTLEWVGFSTQDVSHFVRALSAACHKVRPCSRVSSTPLIACAVQRLAHHKTPYHHAWKSR